MENKLVKLLISSKSGLPLNMAYSFARNEFSEYQCINLHSLVAYDRNKFWLI